MTRSEVKQLLALIKAAYPNHYKGQSDDDLRAAVNVWYLALEDHDATFIGAGIKRLLQTSVYPPVPADVIKSAEEQHYALHNSELFKLALMQTNGLTELNLPSVGKKLIGDGI